MSSQESSDAWKEQSWANYSSTNPEASVIIPTYNSEQNLPKLLAALDKQTAVSPHEFEIIFVIDGSPDDSENVILRWMQHTKLQVCLMVQENQGAGAARNRGIEASRGKMLIFSDSDDFVGDKYISSVLKASREFPKQDIFVTKMLRLNSEGAPLRHPLDAKYRRVNSTKIVSLEKHPDFIHLHGGLSGIRKSALIDSGLRFDPGLRVSFEDAHLIARLLLRRTNPEYVIVPEAEYFYIQNDNSLSRTPNFGKYFDVIKIAYLDLIERSGEKVPTWLGNTVLYDMWWLFQQYVMMQSPVFAFTSAENEWLNQTTRYIIRRIGLDTVRQFKIINLPFDTRAAWESACGDSQVTQMSILRERDHARELQCVAVHSDRDDLNFSAVLGNASTEIAFHKVRSILYFDEPWIYEHRLWIFVPTKRIKEVIHVNAVKANGDAVHLFENGLAKLPRDLGRALGTIRPLPLEYSGNKILLNSLRKVRKRINSFSQIAKFSLALRFARILGLTSKFEDAWVLIDRDNQANDNAEALCRYILRERQDINAWFVINRSSLDFKRLKSEGFRLVKHQSLKHFVLMKQAKVLASSMADHYIVNPFPRHYLPKEWIYVFLQHGVTQDRIHRWLNGKQIDMMVTSTEPERDSIVEDPTPYKMGSREVVLTGMPRHDRFIKLGIETKNRPCILIMPTWRSFLLENLSGGNSRATMPGFESSEYVMNWSGVINSPLMIELSKNPDADVVLLPHPNIDEHWKDLPYPEGMKKISYARDNVQEWLSRATLAVTDYSSQAFEAAFCNAPTVYFQFDHEIFFSGVHPRSPGYFKYDKDGFGPVVYKLNEVDEVIRSMLNKTHSNWGTFAERIDSLFAYRDGNASARVTEEIEIRTRPWKS